MTAYLPGRDLGGEFEHYSPPVVTGQYPTHSDPAAALAVLTAASASLDTWAVYALTEHGTAPVNPADAATITALAAERAEAVALAGEVIESLHLERPANQAAGVAARNDAWVRRLAALRAKAAGS